MSPHRTPKFGVLNPQKPHIYLRANFNNSRSFVADRTSKTRKLGNSEIWILEGNLPARSSIQLTYYSNLHQAEELRLFEQLKVPFRLHGFARPLKSSEYIYLTYPSGQQRVCPERHLTEWHLLAALLARSTSRIKPYFSLTKHPNMFVAGVSDLILGILLKQILTPQQLISVLTISHLVIRQVMLLISISSHMANPQLVN